MNSLDDIKLADFGLSKQFKIPFRKDSRRGGSWPYMAPELLLGRNDYSVLVDLWALGCIMYHMMKGEFLCLNSNNNENPTFELLDKQISIFGTQTFEESNIIEDNSIKLYFQQFKKMEPKGLQVRRRSRVIF
jgi:serine/threonine protein kinase